MSIPCVGACILAVPSLQQRFVTLFFAVRFCPGRNFNESLFGEALLCTNLGAETSHLRLTGRSTLRALSVNVNLCNAATDSSDSDSDSSS